MRFTDPSGHACVEGTSYCVNASTGQTSGSLTSYNNSSTISASLSGEGEGEEEDNSGCGYHLCSEENLYEMGWDNFAQAWNIWTNPNASFGQRYAAGFYMSYWGGAHVLFAAGAAGLICSGFVTCLATVEGALGIGNSACGGDMCSNEITAITSYYPPKMGFWGEAREFILQKGDYIGRRGGDTGRFFAPAGTPAQQLSLRPDLISAPENIFLVTKSFPVYGGNALPWFGQPGGGIQYLSIQSQAWLQANGYIRLISP